jgi:hypothetical protein
MDDLSHWDFAERFKAKEAAALIIGISPEESTKNSVLIGESHLNTSKITPVLRRMESAYNRADLILSGSADLVPEWGDTVDDALGFFGNNYDHPSEPNVFYSEPMETAMRTKDDQWLSMFRTKYKRFEFGSADFSRREIDRWLTALGMTSVYSFVKGKPEVMPKAVDSKQSGHWPWGNYHTELLGHLEAAATRYWVNFDPNDETTAPISKDVAQWLVTERRLSKTTAYSIASILRKDGLRTGPRK